jgi:hypothetical protein
MTGPLEAARLREPARMKPVVQGAVADGEVRLQPRPAATAEPLPRPGEPLPDPGGQRPPATLGPDEVVDPVVDRLAGLPFLLSGEIDAGEMELKARARRSSSKAAMRLRLPA